MMRTSFQVYRDVSFVDDDMETKDEEDHETKVDILTEAGIQANYTPVWRTLLSFLDPKDLTQACLVSRNWNQVVHFDIQANERRKHYLKDMRALKKSIGQVSRILPRSYSFCNSFLSR